MQKLFVIFGILIVIFSLSSIRPKESPENIKSREQIHHVDSEGFRLAKTYCSTCHLFPAPSLLDKKTWLNGVLPNMGFRLGIREGQDPYKELIPEESKIIRELNIYPDKPLLTKEEWEKIVDYYKKNAPEQLPKSKNNSIDKGTQFKTEEIFFKDKQYPKTTLLKFDTISQQLFVGDAQKMLYVLNKDLKLSSAWFTESAPVDIDFPANVPPRILTMGSFKPSDQRKGRLLSFDTTGNNQSSAKIDINKLPRPVQFTTGDLNMDGEEDVIICGFGNNIGELAWYENFDPNKKHILTTQPGARKAIVKDMNQDGKPDIVVLMAQAREGILIFYNLGEGKFKKEKVLQFPPVYGVNDFDLVDFNKDGFPDILLTNGDNWDYSPIEKYYHGIRIFLNNRKNTFEEKYFFPLPGASKAIAKDFNLDGKIDIAIAAFYSNEQSPDKNFIYLENKGNFHFQPFYFPEVRGKWLTMEAADINNDGKIDIILGAHIHSTAELTQLIAKGINNFPQLIILHNQIE